MTRFECWKCALCSRVARRHVRVEILEELHKRIRIPFSVPAGVCGIATCFGTHQRRVLDDLPIPFSPASYPEQVGFLPVPCQRAFRPIDLEPQPVFPPRTHLRY